MAIVIKNKFEVDAGASAVWRFLTDPYKVVACVPGAELIQVVDDRNFEGRLKVKVGPVIASYAGRASISAMNEDHYRVEMVARGRDDVGGLAKAVMVSQLTSSAGGGTEVAMEASIEIAGRLAQFGRGMIEAMSERLFEEFASAVRQHLQQDTQPATSLTKEISFLDLIFYALSARFRRFRRRGPKSRQTVGSQER